MAERNYPITFGNDTPAGSRYDHGIRMKSEAPFFGFAKDPNLDQETAFTICKMIDSVGWNLADDWDWNWLNSEKQDYRSLIKHPLLNGTWKLLETKEWYSLQTVNDEDKKISTIAPLKGLNQLRTLVLQNNSIEELGPLSEMSELKELVCFQNRIADLSPIANLKSLKELSVARNPLVSLQAIEQLPSLQQLVLSNDQIPLFIKCVRLPHLLALTINGDDAVGSLKSFPEMPSLKSLVLEGVENLDGIERYGCLENLKISRGSFSALGKLSGLKQLTHVDLATENGLDVGPLGQLRALRSLGIWSKEVAGWTALNGLPALHEVRADRTLEGAPGLRSLRAELTAWDIEFRSECPKSNPSIDLEVVAQDAFDLYDSRAPYGIRPGETNEGMLRSERAWLVEEIRAALSAKYEEDVDFQLPFTGGFRRSERVILYSVEAYESFQDIVLTLQRILCTTSNDWIVWLQSLLRESPEEQEVPDEMEDFIVWIYPDKIVVAEERADAARKLVS